MDFVSIKAREMDVGPTRNRTVFVTVGTTRFDELIDAVLQPDVLQVGATF